MAEGDLSSVAALDDAFEQAWEEETRGDVTVNAMQFVMDSEGADPGLPVGQLVTSSQVQARLERLRFELRKELFRYEWLQASLEYESAADMIKARKVRMETATCEGMSPSERSDDDAVSVRSYSDPQKDYSQAETPTEDSSKTPTKEQTEGVTTPPPAVDPIKKKEQKRMMIAREILETEDNYCDALEVMVKVYFKPMSARANTPHPIIPDSLTNTIFYMVEDIRGLHLELRDKIRARVESWDSETKLGDLFKNLDHVFEAYLAFVSNYSRAQQTVRQARRQYEEFVHFVDEVALKLKANRKRHSLNDLMIMPIQRIPRYALLLESLIKSTAEDHPDLPDLKEAVESVKEITHFINEGQRYAESVEEVFNIQQRMVGEFEPLEAPGRHLVFEEKAVNWEEGRRRWANLIVLSDMVIGTKVLKASKKPTGPNPNLPTYKYVWSCRVSDLNFSTEEPNAPQDKGTMAAAGRQLKALHAELAKEVDANSPRTPPGTPPKKRTSSSSAATRPGERAERVKRDIAGLTEDYELAYRYLALRVETGGRKKKKHVYLFGREEDRVALIEKINKVKERAKELQNPGPSKESLTPLQERRAARMESMNSNRQKEAMIEDLEDVSQSQLDTITQQEIVEETAAMIAATLSNDSLTDPSISSVSDMSEVVVDSIEEGVSEPGISSVTDTNEVVTDMAEERTSEYASDEEEEAVPVTGGRLDVTIKSGSSESSAISAVIMETDSATGDFIERARTVGGSDSLSEGQCLSAELGGSTSVRLTVLGEGEAGAEPVLGTVTLQLAKVSRDRAQTLMVPLEGGTLAMTILLSGDAQSGTTEDIGAASHNQSDAEENAQSAD
eukprot:comp24039_c1_seq1/m.43052 comp24039_c1_seq1/g.43052  ORF comp24039_c1_seq1/g.43052 comp24039_c1_seq1/m.43052 type:complete len:845 (-) comp24039_c1_seq1:485-3019(-)